jgi:hypothetical protein
MANHIVKDIHNEPVWIEIGHGTEKVALAISDPISGKLSAVTLTPDQARDISRDLLQHADALSIEGTQQ